MTRAEIVRYRDLIRAGANLRAVMTEMIFLETGIDRVESMILTNAILEVLHESASREDGRDKDRDLGKGKVAS